MGKIILITECICVVLLMARWTRRSLSGVYASNRDYHESDAAAVSFLGHLLAGLVSPIGIGVLIGAWLHGRSTEKKSRASVTPLRLVN